MVFYFSFNCSFPRVSSVVLPLQNPVIQNCILLFFLPFISSLTSFFSSIPFIPLFFLPQPTHLMNPLLSASLGSLLARTTDASRSGGSVTETTTVWTTATRLLSCAVSYCTHVHARTQTHTHTRTHAHTHTHTHTHSYPSCWQSQMTSSSLNLTVWWRQNEMREQSLNLVSMCLYVLILCICEYRICEHWICECVFVQGGV